MNILGIRSLRTKVTAVAAAVIAVPVIGIAVFATAYLHQDATRVDTAPVTWRALCTWATLDTSSLPVDIQELELLRWRDHTQVCIDGREVDSRSVRTGDIAVSGIPDGDKKISCKTRYRSSAVVPDLALWPFTDPKTIDYSFVDDNEMRQVFPQEQAFGPRDRNEDLLLQGVQRTFNRQVQALFAGAALLIGLVTATVWWATGRVLRPVDSIRRELAAITAHDLTRRVPVLNGRNEIALLADSVNTTLDRLQAAVEDNRRFVADASHELRSPITALRAELEIAHTHPDLTDWPAVVDGALQDAYRLQHLATDLLLLARLDHDSVTTANTTTDVIDLATLTRDEISRYRTRHTVTLELDHRPTPVHGSHVLLARLLGNLMDNAERHARGHITVRLTSTSTGTDAVLEVLDDGPGIPPEDRERIFDRFTRLDHARTRDAGGTGLGLPIARRIAMHHHGTLRAVDHHGARFIAILPLASDQSTDSDKP